MRIPPIFKALLIQGASFGLMVLILRLSGVQLALWAAAFGCGLIAWVLTRLVRMPGWWQPVQALFVPGLVAMLMLALPSWVYLVLFVTLATVYWSTFKSQVPLYLSSRQVETALVGLLPAYPGFKFVDIGAGLGGLVHDLARTRPDGRFTGIENAPIPFLIAWLRLRGQENCRMQRGDFWQHDLGDYDVVYAYLSPVPMARLWEKVRQEMRPGTLFISNTFEVPGQVPDQVLEIQDFHRSKLLIWRLG